MEELNTYLDLILFSCILCLITFEKRFALSLKFLIHEVMSMAFISQGYQMALYDFDHVYWTWCFRNTFWVTFIYLNYLKPGEMDL